MRRNKAQKLVTGQYTTYSLSLPCFLSSLTHAHSPSRAKSRFCHVHSRDSPPPPLSPREGERERVEERMLSWLYKAERTPNEYIYMPIKIMCYSCGRLACFQGVLAQPDRESGEDTSATFEIWWDVKLYNYKLLFCWAIVKVDQHYSVWKYFRTLVSSCTFIHLSYFFVLCALAGLSPISSQLIS